MADLILPKQNESRHSVRELNRSQRASLRRLLSYYRKRNDDGVTSVRFFLRRPFGRHFFVVVTTRRSDCDKYSPRAILCAARVHASIGPRGGIKINHAEHGLSDATRHVAEMVGGCTR